ncbi:hypothetical protein J6590_092008 [Homalodisca vitripennis]|nr:hypothetical protein J6590_092008 [Homalodisca vitripennis]
MSGGHETSLGQTRGRRSRAYTISSGSYSHGRTDRCREDTRRPSGKPEGEDLEHIQYHQEVVVTAEQIDVGRTRDVLRQTRGRRSETYTIHEVIVTADSRFGRTRDGDDLEHIQYHQEVIVTAEQIDVGRHETERSRAYTISSGSLVTATDRCREDRDVLGKPEGDDLSIYNIMKFRHERLGQQGNDLSIYNIIRKFSTETDRCREDTSVRANRGDLSIYISSGSLVTESVWGSGGHETSLGQTRGRRSRTYTISSGRSMSGGQETSFGKPEGDDLKHIQYHEIVVTIDQEED